MRIEVLHIADCPNWEEAVRLLGGVLAELGITDAEPALIEIRDSEEAAAHRFAGSPTILVDGIDVVPGAVPTTDVACRIYRDGQRSAGVPTSESLRHALVAALGDPEP